MTILRKITENINISQQFQGFLCFDEPMCAHTTFKVGGKADVYAVPADEKSLLFLLSTLIAENIPFFVLGGGSNIVVSDSGIEGFVISTGALNTIKLIDAEGNEIRNPLAVEGDVILYCGAGCAFEQITDFCVQNGLTGLENFAGLPGTVGGAVYMNARCYEKSMSDVLREIHYITSMHFDAMHSYHINEKDWDYKKSPFQTSQKKHNGAGDAKSMLEGAVITSAIFGMKKGAPLAINEKCKYYIRDRESKGHFRYPSAGSVFKNNRTFGKPSGQIIDEVGLRGLRMGNAQIAMWHGNFIVNVGDASADDIKDIVRHIQMQVKKNTGFDLECEIIFCGKFC